ncbi:actin-regulating kinase 1 [Monosporozyma unispora]
MNQPNIQTYTPGIVLTVGSHNVKILKYLTSGGFAQIYSVEVLHPSQSLYGFNLACLKRVIVPDKPSLNVLRAEVDAMKLLRNNKNVVSYIDSHAARYPLQNGAYEVLLLMEYCEKGGLIDFLNTRLQHRLQENEVLNIMSQVCQGVATMHALQPALIHRDIKIENVLISRDGEFKLCDFGSVCGRIRNPNNPQEFAYVQHDIMKNTTAQYRSPEMIDLNRGLPIDEKSDIWALGVFLYKLCYYTTPFEKVGESAILTSKFQFPSYPTYSDNLKHCISKMLLQDPRQRPNIYQVVEEISRLQNVPCPIVNFYNKPIAVATTNSTFNVTPTISQNVRNKQASLQQQAPMIQPIMNRVTVPQQQTKQQYLVTGSGTGQYKVESKPAFKLNKARSTSNLRSSNTTSPPSSSYHEHALLNDKIQKSFRELEQNAKILADVNLSSSSDEEEEEEAEKEAEESSASTSIITNPVKDAEDEDEDKILTSINRYPKVNGRIGGRCSISIVNEKINHLIKVEDPFTSKPKITKAPIVPIKDENSKEKKELSKEEVKQKMLAKLNAVETKFKSTKSNSNSPPLPVSRNKSIKKEENASKKTKPSIPKKPAHLRPQKPKKPAFLVGKQVSEVAGSTSKN